jgi:hypothetical protein
MSLGGTTDDFCGSAEAFANEILRVRLHELQILHSLPKPKFRGDAESQHSIPARPPVFEVE